MEIKIWEIYKMRNYTWYYQVVDITPSDRYWYNELIKKLWIKTKATIVKYHKSTDKNFTFWLVNYMKLSHFKDNIENLSTNYNK